MRLQENIKEGSYGHGRRKVSFLGEAIKFKIKSHSLFPRSTVLQNLTIRLFYMEWFGFI